MCLCINNEATEKFRQENSGEIEVYKLLRVGYSYNKYSIYSPYTNTCYKKGWNRAKSTSSYSLYQKIRCKFTNKRERRITGNVNGGAIHIFLNREDAEKSNKSTRAFILKGKAKVRDLVAIGEYDGFKHTGCFKKIYISEVEIDRVINSFINGVSDYNN